LYESKPFFNTGVPDPDILVLNLSIFYGIPPSSIEDIPISKLLRALWDADKKLSELRRSMFG
jgi:hypothetical protein